MVGSDFLGDSWIFKLFEVNGKWGDMFREYYWYLILFIVFLFFL